MTTDLILVAAIAVMGLAGFGLYLWQAAQQRQTGIDLEAGRVSAVSATTQAAIAQAEADAPRTRQQLLDRLNAGSA
jgi:hypothetical protein